jgi:hypothetical protein
MTLITQAALAARKDVSRAAVSQWKREGRLVMVGKFVDFEKTEEVLVRQSRFHSKRRVPSRTVDVKSSAAPVKSSPNLTEPAAIAVTVAVVLESAASELALILRRSLPLAEVKAIVLEWVEKERDGWVGGRPGLPDACADDDWPKPSSGYTKWRDHPLFSSPVLQEHEWQEIEDDFLAAAARAQP